MNFNSVKSIILFTWVFFVNGSMYILLDLKIIFVNLQIYSRSLRRSDAGWNLIKSNRKTLELFSRTKRLELYNVFMFWCKQIHIPLTPGFRMANNLRKVGFATLVLWKIEAFKFEVYEKDPIVILFHD